MNNKRGINPLVKNNKIDMKNLFSFVACFLFFVSSVMAQKYPGPFVEGGIFPTVTFRAADNQTLTTDDLRGKIVLYTFTDFHKCSVCAALMDGFNALYDMFANDSVVFVAAIANDGDNIEKYQNQYKTKFPIVSFDYDTTLDNIIIQHRNILVGANGKIVLMKSNIIRDYNGMKKMIIDTFSPAIRKQLKLMGF